MEPKKQIFTNQEKKKFLEILKKYSKIVENKHTYSAALKAKNLAWQKITSEFNSSQLTNLHRTPKQLRRLWLNLKHHQRDVITKIIPPLPARGTVSMDDILSGPNMLQIAHPIISGVKSSMDSDVMSVTNVDSIDSETSLYLSEESQNVSNEETPVFSTVKLEPVSPTSADPVETTEPAPFTQLNAPLSPNNRAHITEQHQENSNQDGQSIRQRNLELQDLEIQLLREKLRSQKEEIKSREVRTEAMHNLEYEILKEKHREAKAKADLAELCLRRQNYSND